MLKLTASQLASLECKTHEEASDKIVALFGNFKTQAETITGLQGKLTDATKANADLKATVEASDKKIVALETALGDPKAMTEARIGEIAKAKGSEAAMTALSGTGTGTPVPPAPVGGTTNTPAAKSFPDLVASQVATGKTKADAVTAAIEANHTEYQAWLKTGGKL